MKISSRRKNNKVYSIYPIVFDAPIGLDDFLKGIYVLIRFGNAIY